MSLKEKLSPTQYKIVRLAAITGVTSWLGAFSVGITDMYCLDKYHMPLSEAVDGTNLTENFKDWTRNISINIGDALSKADYRVNFH